MKTNRIKVNLRAFTILEMMVALVLTALAVSFVYAAIRFVQGQGDALAARLGAFGEFNRLQRALQTDARAAAEIRYNGAGIDFLADDMATHYLLLDSHCVRLTAAVADTFRIRVDSLACWFAGERQMAMQGMADETAFFVNVHGHAVPLSVQKHYDAATLTRLTDTITTE
ncbi:prepilin-type N-terminal cleavage/methylation domain-containing protein [Parapedobacter composti]|uniref:Prepilin-type N-terminal cleavage/methylation domain-containing protein n=1 Tax=Parapedobacter composti TaxID=623281 RepID=A0A1I1HIF5_9SPHI|nr:prepilin-type N-terminal cleavage/methylation domain-containing protein [Parapedobacter composti]SFC23352.1 prepilin-type N-terminal cleavage/methylation domain-containing protein [Parapedobacter composti]